MDAGIHDYILYFLGRQLLKAERCDEARATFRELLDNFPDSRWYRPVEGALRSPDACPSLEEEGEREASPPSCSGTGGDEEEADCLFRRRHYQKAKEVYARLASAGGGKGIFYLTRLSQAAARIQDFKTAIRANETLRSRYPKSPAAIEALRKIAFLHQDAGNYRAALPVLEALISGSRSSHERRPYLERVGWCHFRLGDDAKAAQGFDEALSEGETPFALYWKARSLERWGKKKEARDLYRLVVEVYPGSYYALRASQRLQGQDAAQKSTLKNWWTSQGNLAWVHTKEVVPDSVPLRRIHELTAFGLFQDAGVEVRRARARMSLLLPNDPKKIKATEGGYSFEVRRARDESMDYPLPYADLLFTTVKADKVSVDPFLLYGMMRQESRFRESVVSPAGAVGLMQIMPGTGRKLARDAAWDDYDTTWLYDPVTNIELAVLYVRQLAGLFDGRWYAIAASYNAGEAVVREWVNLRKGLSEEEFIEEIPYQETRNYVKKVYANWKAYRFIYGAD